MQIYEKPAARIQKSFYNHSFFTLKLLSFSEILFKLLNITQVICQATNNMMLDFKHSIKYLK